MNIINEDTLILLWSERPLSWAVYYKIIAVFYPQPLSLQFCPRRCCCLEFIDLRAEASNVKTIPTFTASTRTIARHARSPCTKFSHEALHSLRSGHYANRCIVVKDPTRSDLWHAKFWSNPHKEKQDSFAFALCSVNCPFLNVPRDLPVHSISINHSQKIGSRSHLLRQFWRVANSMPEERSVMKTCHYPSSRSQAVKRFVSFEKSMHTKGRVPVKCSTLYNKVPSLMRLPTELHSMIYY